MESNEGRKIRWFEVVYVLALLGLLGLSVFFMSPHRVAVVDGDRLFKELGVAQKVEKARQELDAFKKGTALLQTYNARIKALRGKLDEAKSAADREKVESQIKVAGEMLQQNVGPMQAQLQQFDAAAVGTFRRRIQPFVVKVAQKRRLDVVMYAGPNLIYYRNKADITDDVIAACKSYFAQNLPLIDPALVRGQQQAQGQAQAGAGE
jgi:Skp family chaperone for outer membrane proteins